MLIPWLTNTHTFTHTAAIDVQHDNSSGVSATGKQAMASLPPASGWQTTTQWVGVVSAYVQFRITKKALGEALEI